MVWPDLRVLLYQAAELRSAVVFNQNNASPLKALFHQLRGEGAHKHDLEEPEINAVIRSQKVHRVEDRSLRGAPADEHRVRSRVAVELNPVDECGGGEVLPAALVDLRGDHRGIFRDVAALVALVTVCVEYAARQSGNGSPWYTPPRWPL